MSFKSLLLSKDTEVVLALTRLLKDLDIAVEPCTEPFAAAKRLMDQRFDAILVDCDDEQGAGWVLQSARMAVASKKCVTIAIVGPRSASRGSPKGGENFVIQKPIVLKQVESTLRAARTLMGDGGGAPHAEAPASASAPATPTPIASPVLAAPLHAAPAAQGRPPAEMFDELTAAVDRLGPQSAPTKPVVTPPSVSAGAAAAAAPAWDKPAPVLPPPVPRQEPTLRPAPVRPELSTPPSSPLAGSSAVVPLAAAPAEMKPAVRPVQDAPMDALEERRRRMNATSQPAWRTEVERPEVPVPRFSGLATEIEPRKAFPFKAIAVVMVLVSLALFGYSWYRDRHTATTPAVQTQTAVPASAPQPATTQTSTPAPAEAPVSSGEQVDNSAAEVKPQSTSSEDSSSSAKTVVPPKREEEDTSSSERASESSLPPAPMVVSGGKLHSSSPAKEEAPVAPSLSAVASSGKPDLGGVASSAAAPLPKLVVTPERIRVSQGVTQGLLVHQVSPQYPAMARETRVEGDVLLEALIGKDGTVRDLKAVSGPPLLIQAAISAVRQWRYKPYLLNGQPVEVETQIKLQFRL